MVFKKLGDEPVSDMHGADAAVANICQQIILRKVVLLQRDLPKIPSNQNLFDRITLPVHLFSEHLSASLNVLGLLFLFEPLANFAASLRRAD